MSDLEEYIAERKKRDVEFAEDFEIGYERFKIGAIIKEMRLEQGMTQEQLAEKLETKKSVISRMENHAEDVRLSTLEKIANVFGRQLKNFNVIEIQSRKSILLKTADNVGMEIENIFDYFSDIKIVSNHDGYFYSVNEALKILLLGLLCGRKNIREIHEWATADIIKDRLNKEFGIKKTPCYYWLTCLLKLINIDSLNECFMNMAEALIKEYGTEKPLTIAIDGKTIRSTDKMSSYESPLHIVSAQVAEFGITLAQKCVKGKTNEIPTVQSLIKTLNIKGHIIVTDALNCQKETAKIIKEGKGDYLLSVKGNQPLLKADIEEYVQDEILRKQMDTACKSEKNRERVEKRTAFCTTNLGWMDNTDEWEGLSCIGVIHSEFKSKKGKSDEWHYYISSRKLTAQQLLDIARKEWVVETMHWLLDVHFREDFCRLLDKNLQQALNIGRKVALNLVSRYKQKNAPKASLSHIMFKALMDISFIKKILQN